MEASRPFARRRLPPIQAKVRAITQRLGRSCHPVGGERLTIWMHRPRTAAPAASTCRAMEPASARTRSRLGQRARRPAITRAAPSRSWMPAECTTTRSGRPRVYRPAGVAFGPVSRCRFCGPWYACRRRRPPGSPEAPPFRRPGRLAVEDAGVRVGRSPLSLTLGFDKRRRDRLPHTVALEAAEDVADRAARRKAPVPRQGAPRTAGAQKIEQRIRRRPHVRRSRPPTRLRRRDQPLQFGPLAIRQAARIVLRSSPVPITIRRRPYRAPPARAAPTGSPCSEPQQPLLGQVLRLGPAHPHPDGSGHPASAPAARRLPGGAAVPVRNGFEGYCSARRRRLGWPDRSACRACRQKRSFPGIRRLLIRVRPSSFKRRFRHARSAG